MSYTTTPINDHLSSLYTILPSALQSRIPRLVSIRRTIRRSTQFSLSGASNISRSPVYISASETRSDTVRDVAISPFALTSDPSETPTPSLTRASSVASSRPGTPQADLEALWGTMSSWSTSRPDSKQLALSRGELVKPPSRTTRVELNRDYNTILGLLNIANRPDIPPDLSRVLVVDSICYLLRSLSAEELGEHEIQTLRMALPNQVKSYDDTPETAPRSAQQGSSLHMVVVQIITWMFVSLAVLFPYLVRLFNSLYEFERQHKLSERLFVFVVALMAAAGERQANVGDAVDQFTSSKMGRFIADSVHWIWEGLVGGIGDGITQGFKILVEHSKQEGEKEMRRDER